MSALNFLRGLKKAARNFVGDTQSTPEGAIEQTEGNNIRWGNYDYIKSVGIDSMTRKELRNHLDARDLSSLGNRKELTNRLEESMNEEKLRQNVKVDANMEEEVIMKSDIEERGSVYVCGSNSKGELGLGDTLPRRFFTPIPQLRGIGVCHVVAGVDMSYAITEEHDVYVWGGGGFGKTGVTSKIDKKRQRKNNNAEENWLSPRILTDLFGEEVSSVSIGLSHCIALGRGGDCFVWGDNDTGQLGMNDFNPRDNIEINENFPAIGQVSCGANHSCALFRTGEVYSWGHAGNGRLGIGAVERLGVVETEKQSWPMPQHIKTLESIRTISCGADHTLAFGASGVWAWGSGAGGKLGLGDTKDRFDPCLIPKLRGKFVMQLAAGTWHSMALVAYPPMISGGWVLTWGSGYHGQLAQGLKQISLVPEVVEYFTNVHLLCKAIATGSHHSAALTTDGELYTWGSNTNGCLGRKIDENDVLFTPTPGYVAGFGAIIEKTGRGQPRSIACGKEFTIVCTYPYSGPNLQIAIRIMEEAKIREQEALLAKKAEQQLKNAITHR